MKRWPTLVLFTALFAPTTFAATFDVARALLMRKLALHAKRAPIPNATFGRRRAVQPPVITPCTPLVLFQPVEVMWLSISGDNVYVSGPDVGISRVPKAAGSLTLVVPTVGLQIGQFVIDAGNIYFLTADDEATGSLYRVALSGGTPTLLANKLPAPVGIVQDSTSLYILNFGTIMGDEVAPDGSIERIGKDGTGRTVLAKDLNAPFNLAVDATDVYFVESGLATASTIGGVRRVAKSGGTVTKIIDSDFATAVAVNATHVFYSSFGTSTPTVNRIAKAGGTPQTLLVATLAVGLEVRDTTLYAAVGDASFSTTFLVAVPVDGGLLKIIVAEDLDSEAMAFDDCMVYYAAGLRLERAAR